ncbi:MAG: YjgN family protein [Treponema sp.]|nr:YjgN family protein [Treponema sp.]
MESKFSGKVISVFLFCLWAPILLMFTLGLATPFIVCTVIRWICNNSIISGKTLTFKGTAGGLFGRWILWYVLTILTFGIYGFWSTRNQIKWVIENTEITN